MNSTGMSALGIRVSFVIRGDGMAKRKWNLDLLSVATERLLVERGYHGFHFGALIEMLAIKRTTLYDHFRDKDELILAYVEFRLTAVLDACNQIQAQRGDAFSDLLEILRVLIPYAPFMGVLATVLPFIDRNRGDVDRFERIDEMNSELRQFLFDAIGQGQWSGAIRKDISAKRLTDYLIYGLQFVDPSAKQDRKSTEQLIDVLIQGVRITKMI